MEKENMEQTTAPKMNIQWFPGHMKKSFRELETSLKNIDAVICVLDARAPFSCINPELEKICSGKKIIYAINKTDLADSGITKEWVEFFKNRGKAVLCIDATSSRCKNFVIDAINSVTKEKQEKQKQRGILSKIRVAIVGVPNTGKSTLLNTLAGAYLSKTGNLAGVTRSSSWVKLKNNIELMDNAGTLYPKFSNQKVAENLAILGSLNDTVVDEFELSLVLISKLKKIAREKFTQRFSIQIEEDEAEESIFEKIGKARGFIVKGGEIDTKRTADAIIDDYRKTRIGKISLERPDFFKTGGETNNG